MNVYEEMPGTKRDILSVIRENAEIYRGQVFRRDGSITINHDQTVNKVFDSNWLQDMTFEQLQEVAYILMHMSRNSHLNAIIENDHLEFFSLVNVVVILSKKIDGWIINHNPLFSYIDSQLVNELKPQYTDNGNKLFQNALLMNLHYHQIFPAVWTGFAYLEGICRRICRYYINVDGTVLKPFKIKRVQYRSTRGNKKASKGHKGKIKINNLGHILELSRRQVSSQTRQLLSKFFQDYPSDQIFDWRNDSLHGSEDRSTTVIVLYSLIAIFLLDLLNTSRS